MGVVVGRTSQPHPTSQFRLETPTVRTLNEATFARLAVPPDSTSDVNQVTENKSSKDPNPACVTTVKTREKEN